MGEFRSHLRSAKPIIRWNLLSVVVSIGFVEAMGRTSEAGGTLVWHLLLGVAWVAALIFPLLSVAFAIKRSFTPQEQKTQVIVIIVSYLGLILSFSGAYYSMACLGDRLDARHKYEYYSDRADYVGPGGQKVVRTSSRAFSGIERRLWSGVDWPDYPDNYLRDQSRSPVGVDEMIRRARMPFKRVSDFQYDARTNVFGNLLYFSVVTMATLGYGDITPNIWFAKFVANIQVLSGLTLFYFALSMVIGGWWTKQE